MVVISSFDREGRAVFLNRILSERQRPRTRKNNGRTEPFVQDCRILKKMILDDEFKKNENHRTIEDLMGIHQKPKPTVLFPSTPPKAQKRCLADDDDDYDDDFEKANDGKPPSNSDIIFDLRMVIYDDDDDDDDEDEMVDDVDNAAADLMIKGCDSAMKYRRIIMEEEGGSDETANEDQRALSIHCQSQDDDDSHSHHAARDGSIIVKVKIDGSTTSTDYSKATMCTQEGKLSPTSTLLSSSTISEPQASKIGNANGTKKKRRRKNARQRRKERRQEMNTRHLRAMQLDLVYRARDCVVAKQAKHAFLTEFQPRWQHRQTIRRLLAHEARAYVMAREVHKLYQNKSELGQVRRKVAVSLTSLFYAGQKKKAGIFKDSSNSSLTTSSEEKSTSNSSLNTSMMILRRVRRQNELKLLIQEHTHRRFNKTLASLATKEAKNQLFENRPHTIYQHDIRRRSSVKHTIHSHDVDRRRSSGSSSSIRSRTSKNSLRASSCAITTRINPRESPGAPYPRENSNVPSSHESPNILKTNLSIGNQAISQTTFAAAKAKHDDSQSLTGLQAPENETVRITSTNDEYHKSEHDKENGLKNVMLQRPRVPKNALITTPTRMSACHSSNPYNTGVKTAKLFAPLQCSPIVSRGAYVPASEPNRKNYAGGYAGDVDETSPFSARGSVTSSSRSSTDEITTSKSVKTSLSNNYNVVSSTVKERALLYSPLSSSSPDSFCTATKKKRSSLLFKKTNDNNEVVADQQDIVAAASSHRLAMGHSAAAAFSSSPSSARCDSPFSLLASPTCCSLDRKPGPSDIITSSKLDLTPVLTLKREEKPSSTSMTRRKRSGSNEREPNESDNDRAATSSSSQKKKAKNIHIHHNNECHNTKHKIQLSFIATPRRSVSEASCLSPIALTLQDVFESTGTRSSGNNNDRNVSDLHLLGERFKSSRSSSKEAATFTTSTHSWCKTNSNEARLMEHNDKDVDDNTKEWTPNILTCFLESSSSMKLVAQQQGGEVCHLPLVNNYAGTSCGKYDDGQYCQEELNVSLCPNSTNLSSMFCNCQSRGRDDTSLSSPKVSQTLLQSGNETDDMSKYFQTPNGNLKESLEGCEDYPIIIQDETVHIHKKEVNEISSFSEHNDEYLEWKVAQMAKDKLFDEKQRMRRRKTILYEVIEDTIILVGVIASITTLFWFIVVGAYIAVRLLLTS